MGKKTSFPKGGREPTERGGPRRRNRFLTGAPLDFLLRRRRRVGLLEVVVVAGLHHKVDGRGVSLVAGRRQFQQPADDFWSEETRKPGENAFRVLRRMETTVNLK